MLATYQNAEQVPAKILHAADIAFGFDCLSTAMQPDNHRYLEPRGKLFVGRINTLAKAPTARVSSVEQFDGFGNLYRVAF